MEKPSELKLFCVVSPKDRPLELVRKKNGELFETTLEGGSLQHLVIFGFGPWHSEKNLQVELTAADDSHVIPLGQVSSKCRCLYWEGATKESKTSASMRLSCTVMADPAKTDKPKKGKTQTKNPTTNQTVCVKNEEKLTKSKRKSEEVWVEKTKLSAVSGQCELLVNVKRQCKGLGKGGLKESARKKKVEGKKTSKSESSDCQSPSNSCTAKDTVAKPAVKRDMPGVVSQVAKPAVKRDMPGVVSQVAKPAAKRDMPGVVSQVAKPAAKRDMPKRACMGKTAVDSNDSQVKGDTDVQPLKDKDMNIMCDARECDAKEGGVGKEGMSRVEGVQLERPADVTPAVIAVKSQRKLLSSVSPSKRWGHSLCMISESEAVLVGGQGDKQQFCKDSIWHLDLEKGKWTSQGKTSGNQKPDMRMGHTAIYDPTVGSIYIYGGSKNLKWFSDIQVIGTDDWQWQMVKANGKAPARAYHSGTLYRHELWVFGGVYPRPDPQPDGCSNDIHVFNPMDESWYEPIINGTKPAPRSGHSATLLQDNLVVFGGWDAPVCFNDLHVLDLGIVEWVQPTIIGTPPSPRSWHASCALAGSRVLIHGGYNGNNALDDTFIFNLECATWTRVEMSLPRQPRTGHSALCLPYKHSNDGHDEVIVFGGGDNDGAFFQDLDIFMVPLEQTTHDTNIT